MVVAVVVGCRAPYLLEVSRRYGWKGGGQIGKLRGDVIGGGGGELVGVERDTETERQRDRETERLRD